MGVQVVSAGEEFALPPPPKSAEPPPVNIALLKPPARSEGVEVIWSDDAAPKGSAPEIPAAVPSVPASQDIQRVLEAVGQEAPRSATLESMLFQQIRQAMPEGSEGYIFEKASLPDNSGLPASGWKVRYDFRPPARGIGQTPFSAIVTGTDGKLIRRFSGSVQIDREAQGIQVTRVIRKGETMGPADIKVLGTRLSLLPRGAFDNRKMIDGTIATQELRPGQWLTEQMVQVPELVKRGQPVTIHLARGPIQITAPGITRQDGALGEVIRVQNAQSKREIYARVASKDEVQVIF